MSGHNKWTQIKHKKASADQARAKLFSKLAKNISIAARSGSDPKFNPALRSAIDQAKKQNMPHANIERAIKRVSEKGSLEPVLVEAYGPGGAGVLVDALTDNKNRTLGELRLLFKKHDIKTADPGSLLWSFKKTLDGYEPNIRVDIPKDERDKVSALVEELKEHEDVMGVYVSCGLD